VFVGGREYREREREREMVKSLPIIKRVDIEAENCPPIVSDATIDVHLSIKNR
jgi:hypothetical protein